MIQFPIPLLSLEQMHEVEHLLVEMYGITLLQTMENAGRNLALLAKQLLEDDLDDRPLVILAGRGNNGGGGLVAARHLFNWGAWVQIVLAHPVEEYNAAPAHQLQTLQAMDVPLAWAEEGWELPPADLVIDAMIGGGLRGHPTGKARDLIQLANSTVAPILSLDVPSGLDLATGALCTPHIRATATMTLGLPPTGLVTAPAQSAIGDLYLADIGVPRELYETFELEVPPFFGLDTVIPVQIRDGTVWVVSQG